jgi:hypothetical protein
LWMLGQDIGQSEWPGCGEIDVMEHFGTGPATVHRTVHGPGYSGRGGISASRAVGPSLGRDSTCTRSPGTQAKSCGMSTMICITP